MLASSFFSRACEGNAVGSAVGSQIRSPTMMGEDQPRPGISVCQVGGSNPPQWIGRVVASAVPSPFGARNWGQSAAQQNSAMIATAILRFRPCAAAEQLLVNAEAQRRRGAGKKNNGCVKHIMTIIAHS